MGKARCWAEYTPMPSTLKKVYAFEESINMPLKTWLTQQAAKGHGVRAIAECAGLGYRVVYSFMYRWNIKRTGGYRPVREDGSLNISAVIRNSGLDVEMHRRKVVARMKRKGMTVQEAIASVKKKYVRVKDEDAYC